MPQDPQSSPSEGAGDGGKVGYSQLLPSLHSSTGHQGVGEWGLFGPEVAAVRDAAMVHPGGDGEEAPESTHAGGGEIKANRNIVGGMS